MIHDDEPTAGPARAGAPVPHGEIPGQGTLFPVTAPRSTTLSYARPDGAPLTAADFAALHALARATRSRAAAVPLAGEGLGCR